MEIIKRDLGPPDRNAILRAANLYGVEVLIVEMATTSETSPIPTDIAVISKYTYNQLDSSRNQIRLLQVLPHANSSADQEVHCSLFAVSLDDEPNYEALSYVWGDPSNPAEILLDGCRFFVTRNLAAALQALQNSSTERVMWIDAICINQESIAERNEQVQKMRMIYQLARQVVSWLGPAFEGSREAFGLLHQLNKQRIGDKSKLTRITTDPSCLSGWEGIIKLSDLPYWHRIVSILT